MCNGPRSPMTDDQALAITDAKLLVDDAVTLREVIANDTEKMKGPFTLSFQYFMSSDHKTLRRIDHLLDIPTAIDLTQAVNNGTNLSIISPSYAEVFGGNATRTQPLAESFRAGTEQKAVPGT